MVGRLQSRPRPDSNSLLETCVTQIQGDLNRGVVTQQDASKEIRASPALYNQFKADSAAMEASRAWTKLACMTRSPGHPPGQDGSGPAFTDPDENVRYQLIAAGPGGHLGLRPVTADGAPILTAPCVVVHRDELASAYRPALAVSDGLLSSPYHLNNYRQGSIDLNSSTQREHNAARQNQRAVGQQREELAPDQGKVQEKRQDNATRDDVNRDGGLSEERKLVKVCIAEMRKAMSTDKPSPFEFLSPSVNDAVRGSSEASALFRESRAGQELDRPWAEITCFRRSGIAPTFDYGVGDVPQLLGPLGEKSSLWAPVAVSPGGLVALVPVDENHNPRSGGKTLEPVVAHFSHIAGGREIAQRGDAACQAWRENRHVVDLCSPAQLALNNRLARAQEQQRVEPDKGKNGPTR